MSEFAYSDFPAEADAVAGNIDGEIEYDDLDPYYDQPGDPLPWQPSVDRDSPEFQEAVRQQALEEVHRTVIPAVVSQVAPLHAEVEGWISEHEAAAGREEGYERLGNLGVAEEHQAQVFDMVRE